MDKNPADTGRIACPHCGTVADIESFKKAYRVCETCNYHARLHWQERLEYTADAGSFKELDPLMESKNPIGFPEYASKIAALQQSCNAKEAVVTGECTIKGYPAVIGIMDSHFMMGSMGSVVGEKVARALEYGTAAKLPVIIFAASGGARMQEGIFSLMQMAKTAAAVARHNQAGQLYLSVITDPTTGGVTASFASLGDIIIAEPGALIGFAGKRVTQDTIGEKLPEGFQTAEFVQEHGFTDIIVPRSEMRDMLARFLKMHLPGAAAGRSGKEAV
jgi:acetyl-CoA carboxylase carboxyl transferase subunit beta